MNEKRTNASHERYEQRTIHETNARYNKLEFSRSMAVSKLQITRKMLL
jgi:hypothetical protein